MPHVSALHPSQKAAAIAEGTLFRSSPGHEYYQDDVMTPHHNKLYIKNCKWPFVPIRVNVMARTKNTEKQSALPGHLARFHLECLDCSRRFAYRQSLS